MKKSILNFTKFPLIVSVIALMLCAGQAWGASQTRYVSPTGDNSDGTTWAKAYNLASSAITELNGINPTATTQGAGHFLYIAPGTYTDNLNLADAQLAGISIIGTAAHGSTSSAVYGQVIFNPNDNTIPIAAEDTVDNLIVKNIVFRGSGTASSLYFSGTAEITNILIENCHFESRANQANHLAYMLNVTGTVSGCTFRYVYSASNRYLLRYLTGANNVVFNYCLFTSSTHGPFSGNIRIQGGTATFNNCIIMDSYQHGVHAMGGTTNINNSIIQGGTGASDGYALLRGSTLNVSNSIIIGGIVPTQLVSGVLDIDSNNQYGVNPKWKQYGKNGTIVVRVDDIDALESGYLASLATLLGPKGYKGTYYVPLDSIQDSASRVADVATLRTIISNGVFELGSHGRTHTVFGYQYALNFSQAGGANCTVAFDGTTITLNCDGIDFDNSYVVTNKKFVDIVTNLNGIKGWTVVHSSTDGQNPTRIINKARATSLATLAETAAPTDIQFDLSAYNAGLYNDEIYTVIADFKTEIDPTNTLIDGQTGAEWEIKTIGHPYDYTVASARTAVITSGYQAASSNNASSINTSVHDVDLYSVYNLSQNLLQGATETIVRQNAAAIAMLAIHTGLIFTIIGHDPDAFEDTPTLEQWEWILDEWSKFSGLKITSKQLLASTIRAGWTDDEDGTYSKTFSSYDENYSPLASSPAINAGAAVGGLHTGSTIVGGDAAGNTRLYGSGVDIGAYERKKFLEDDLTDERIPKYYTVP